MSDESKKRVFNKYLDNRRLWDVTNGAYATIADVVKAVEEGADVSVIATRGRGKTQEGTDITVTVLVDAFQHQQQHLRPTVQKEALVALMRGRKPLKWG